MAKRTTAVLCLLGLTTLLAPGALPAQAAPDPDIDLGTDEQRSAGERVYAKYCSQCHGDDGAGQGIATPYLRPAPRDFTAGKYKIRSTPTGYVPTDEDLRRAIREGLPGTGMPAFETLTEGEIRDVVYYLKSLAPDFEDPQAYAEPIDIPEPPPFSEDSLEVGFQTYVEIGCARCHGEQGRGDGRSAPTLRDDWGDFVPPADLTMPWLFRGGGSRQDIYRSISTGLAGSPMAGFADGLSEEQRWQIVDWIVAQARRTGATGEPGEPPYGTLVRAVPAPAGAGALEAIAEDGDPAAARELFVDAPKTLFPVAGQVVHPGRSFRPGTVAIGAQAIYGPEAIAFLVTWHNLSAETDGSNAPGLEVPPQDGVPFRQGPEEEAETGTGPDGQGSDEGDFWGTGTGDDQAAGEPERGAAPESEGGEGGFWGEEPSGTSDVFGEQSTGAQGRPPGSDEFSDALALQFPIELREGVEKPHFLYGDPQYPVELWHVDLADPVGRLYEGRGADAVAPADGVAPTVLADYADGEWAVVFVRDRRPAEGVEFAEDSFVPIAFSVWDGFYRERGSRRGITRWFHVYVDPPEDPEVVAPMAKAGLAVLALELVVIGLVRRRKTSA